MSSGENATRMSKNGDKNVLTSEIRNLLENGRYKSAVDKLEAPEAILILSSARHTSMLAQSLHKQGYWARALQVLNTYLAKAR